MASANQHSTTDPKDRARGQLLHNEHQALRRFWHPVARSEDVGTEPQSVMLLGEPWCLVRIDDVLTALPDRCPHRFAPLSAGRVVDGALECGYHGYRFASDGTCVEIPAIGVSADNGGVIPPKAHCGAAFAVTDHLGLVWLAPEEPLVGLPQVPEHDDPTFVNCPVPALDWNAGAAQMTDNFLDQGHFPFLHLATFGAVQDRMVPDYTLERDGHTFTVNHTHVTQALADSSRAGSDRTDDIGSDDNRGADEVTVAERHDVFVFTPPHHVYLRISYPAENAVLTISFCHQPVDAETTRLYCTDYRDDINDTAEDRQATVDYQLAVAGEDKTMLEQFRTKSVPLDPTAEVHTKADRITLEMRRIMADLVERAR